METQDMTFNWLDWLKDGPFNEAEMYKKYRMAGRWDKCATANLMTPIERERDGKPVNKEIENLGYRFASVVADMSIFYGVHEDKFNHARATAIGIAAQIETTAVRLAA